MSQENVEIARRAMKSADAFFDILDEYVVCDYRDYRLVEADEVEMGKQVFIDSTLRFWGAFEEYAIEAEEFIDAGMSVVIVMREHGRGKGSGVPIDRHWAWLWTFRRGKLVRLEPFRAKEEALEAAGLQA